MGVTEEIVRFIRSAEYKDLPTDVVLRTRNLITDAIGVMLAGSVEDGSRIIRDYACGIEGKKEASLIGGGARVAAGVGALANAASGHALDYDSIQLSSWPGTAHGIRLHPTVPALAAALAVGEPLDISGPSLILACALGIEVSGRVTEAIPPDAYQVAYQSTATMGGLGAAAAAGKLLNLDETQLMRALSLAATMAGGLRENFGTMTKSFHSGRSAEAGVLAAKLAKAGFTAAPNILEARRGFFLAMGGRHDPSQISGKLGSPYFVLDPGMHVKRYPCAILTHPSIKATLEIVRTHNLQADDVAAVEIGVSEVVTSTLAHNEPTTGLEGKFSVAFPLALALSDRKVTLAQFTDEKVSDAKITGLIQRIKVSTDPQLAKKGGNEVAAQITINLKSGRSIETLATLATGQQQEWISATDLEAKFRECASRALSSEAAEKLLERLNGLEREKSVITITELARG